MRGELGGSDRVLFLQERGRVRSLLGDRDGSIADYQEASDLFDEVRMRPALSLSMGFFSSTSLATNDLALPYPSYPYEKLMVHNYLALNYLRNGDLERARIELNRADVEQTFAADQNRLLVERTQRQLRENQIDPTRLDHSLRDQQSRFAHIGESQTASFLNAFTYFLSGILFETLDEWDRAIIDFRKALEIQPGNNYIREALVRAQQIRDGQRSTEAEDGRIVVIYSDGFVAPRSSIHIPFFYETSILQVVMPYYSDRTIVPAQPLHLRTRELSLGETKVITNLNAMAANALNERYMAIFARQIMRLVVKRRVQREAEEVSPLAGFIANVMNLVTDKADQRSWLTLPGYLQIATLSLPEGEHKLFYGTSVLSEQSLELEIAPSQTVFVIIDRIGNTFYTTATETFSP